MLPITVEPRGNWQVPSLAMFAQGVISSCILFGPRMRELSPLGSSIRPPQHPKIGPPLLSMATLPARMIRSPQESLEPYLSLIGSRSLRAWLRFPLSGHSSSGANRMRPPSQPPTRQKKSKQNGGQMPFHIKVQPTVPSCPILVPRPSLLR